MHAIGIDLGTTYSAAAISDDGLSARILQNQEGQSTTPSVVFFQDTCGDEEPLVGTMAKNAAASAPYNVVQFIKRQMGNPKFKYTSPNGNDFFPEEISAIILKYIKQYAELTLGEPVNDAVITVPAYFDDIRRTATKQAGIIAGLNVLQVFNEPTAAAIAYGLNTESGKILVYDLGGGTFDITLMNVNNGHFDVIATDGDSNLGGFDFDNELVRLIIEKLAQQGYIVDEYDDFLYAEIREKAEVLKRGLSNVEQSSALFTIKGKTYLIRITRDEFEKASASLLKRTQERLEILLESQNCRWDDIDHVLMVGGSTRMPMVKRMLEELSGKKLKYEVDPDTAVALGAGVYAYMLFQEAGAKNGIPGSSCGIAISDVTSQSLGIISVDEFQQEANSVIIRSNSKIPCKQSEVFVTVADNQTCLNVRVTEGNDEDIAYVNIIGEQLLRIPPYPKGAPVRVTFAYDIDQTIYVEVEDLTAGVSLGVFDIDRVGNLDGQQVEGLARKVGSLNVE